MELLQAVLLGILQGAAEFLPISSSGHLVLAEEFFKIEQAGLTFDVSLHMGTLLAVLVYFRADILAILSALLRFKDQGQEQVRNRQIGFLICTATLPAAVAGVFLNDYAESTFRSPVLVASTLAGAGALLLWSEWRGHHNRDFRTLTFKDALIIGLAQSLALVPGVSRSGITMTAGLFRDLDRSAVARFSFLMSVPIIAGAGVLNLFKIIKEGFAPGQAAFFLWGFLASAASGYLFISFLMKFIKTRSFAVFAYYRFVLAAIVVYTLVL